MNKNSEAGNHAHDNRRSRSVLVAVLLILVVLLSAGSGLYAGASFFAQQAPNVTITTTIFTTTTSWATSTVWSTLTETVQGILTTIEYTTSTSTVTVSASDTWTKLLLHMDGTDGSRTFVDSSLQTHSIAVGGDAQIDAAQSKFGGASGLFDGNGDYLSTSDSADWAFGSGDFTIDMWVRRGSTGTVQYIIGQVNSGGADASGSWFVRFDPDNRVAGGIVSGGTWYMAYSSATVTDTNTWHHVALVRNGGSMRIYLDGAGGPSTNVGTVSANDATSQLAVGRLGEYNGVYFNGWLDEIRVSKGVARWTTNFTPPAAPY